MPRVSARVLLLALVLATMASCRRPAADAPLATAAPGARVAGAVFHDSALFRALCREADTIRVLTPVPRRCTPRREALDIR
jgi:hypothetical protein